MKPLAAIDVGSNGVRLIVAELTPQNQLVTLDRVRSSVRLGTDSFGKGVIEEANIAGLCAAFDSFKKVIKFHNAFLSRAVGTSALRDAKNQSEVLARVQGSSGIRLEVISGKEESELIFLATSHTLDLRNSAVAFIDIGGGSVEIGFSVFGRVTAAESFAFGTVRLLQMMKNENMNEKDLAQYLNKNMTPIFQFLKQNKPPGELAAVVGTGGNMEAMGKLRTQFFAKKAFTKLNYNELSQLIIHISSMNISERIHVLKLRPDRADVVIPAMLITHIIMEKLGATKLRLPHVGLREGLILKAVDQLEHIDARMSARNILSLIRK